MKLIGDYMWIDKAAENYFGNIRFLFEDFFDRYTFNNIKIGKKRILNNGEEVYIVKATQYIEGNEVTFYFGDFSVMRDVMENKNYAIKSSHKLIDAEWGSIVKNKLDKEDQKEYKKQFKEYHKNQLEDEKEYLKML